MIYFAFRIYIWLLIALMTPPYLIHDNHTLATCERWAFIQGKSITTMTIETRDTLIFETRELSLIEYKMRIKLKTQ